MEHLYNVLLNGFLRNGKLAYGRMEGQYNI